MAITWLTPAGTIFDFPPGSFLFLSVEATNATEYSLICGELPPGIEFQSDGSITGMVGEVDRDTTYTFVIRATDGVSIRDRTFSFVVNYDETTTWATDGFSVEAGTLKKLLVNRDFVEIQLNANLDFPVTYYIDRDTGRLPFGLTMTAEGKIYGLPKIVLSPSEAIEYPLDIVATDGFNNYRQSFIFSVIDSNSFTVDNATFFLGDDAVSLIDLGNTGTVSLSSLQAPEFIRNPNLGTVLADDRAYLNVSAFDPNPGKGPVRYTTPDSLPPNLTLDPALGYLYGELAAQADFSHRYNFRITATKTDIALGNHVVNTGTFFLQVVNQWYNNVIWPSSSLGTLTEGITSELAVTARQRDDTYNLNYYLLPNSNFPSGLTLSTSTGHIIGSATTSGNFSFTVAASTASYTGLEAQLIWPVLSNPVSFKEFNLSITPVSKDYTSIWARPFLNLTQRSLWEDFINNDNIFLPDTIYRADDPSFGVQTDLKIFLQFGIEKINIGDYAQSLYQNLYMRRLSFGSVKAAIAKDRRGNHIYDAVYVDVVDNLEGLKNAIEISGTTYYPGSIDNIRNSLESIVLDNGQEIAVDGLSLPKFMTTVNADQPYGYFKAAVLCYTLPGQASKVINRIRASKFNFDNLDFFIDRLIVQNSLDQTGTSYISFNTQPIG